MQYVINTEKGYIRDIFGLTARFQNAKAAESYVVANLEQDVKVYEITSIHGEVVKTIRNSFPF